jgi:hypothetical protein
VDRCACLDDMRRKNPPVSTIFLLEQISLAQRGLQHENADLGPSRCVPTAPTAPRGSSELRERGETVTEKTVAAIMAEIGIEGISPRTFTVRTAVTDPTASFPSDLARSGMDIPAACWGISLPTTSAPTWSARPSTRRVLSRWRCLRHGAALRSRRRVHCDVDNESPCGTRHETVDGRHGDLLGQQPPHPPPPRIDAARPHQTRRACLSCRRAATVWVTLSFVMTL